MVPPVANPRRVHHHGTTTSITPRPPPPRPPPWHRRCPQRARPTTNTLLGWSLPPSLTSKDSSPHYVNRRQDEAGVQHRRSPPPWRHWPAPCDPKTVDLMPRPPPPMPPPSPQVGSLSRLAWLYVAGRYAPCPLRS
jgi:hypothetical protein